jgi:hypothetical protein
MTIDAIKNRAMSWMASNVPILVILGAAALLEEWGEKVAKWAGWLNLLIATHWGPFMLLSVAIGLIVWNERLVSRRRYFAVVAATALRKEMTIDVSAQITAAMAPVVQQIHYLLEFENDKRKFAALAEMAAQGYFDPNYCLKNPVTMDRNERMKRLKRTLERHGITVDITGMRRAGVRNAGLADQEPKENDEVQRYYAVEMQEIQRHMTMMGETLERKINIGPERVVNGPFASRA